MPFFSRRTFSHVAVLLPLLLAYVQVIRFVSDMGVGWQLVEVGAWKPALVDAGFPKSFKDLGVALNWQLMEYEPRVTRPLSNVIELFDTPFRAMLWRYMTPPPSLSLTWPFSLIAGPLLLYLLLRRLNVQPWIAILAVALYVANPGVMSLEVMIFRPGKAMANVAILFCLWFAAGLDRARKTASTNSRRLNLYFALLCLSAFVSFFLDEVALIIFPAIALLFPRLVFRSRIRLALFASLPVAYYVTIIWCMPALSSRAGFPIPPSLYAPAQTMIAAITFHLPADQYKTIFDNIWKNSATILRDSFGIINPVLTKSAYYFVAVATILGAFITIAATCISAWRGQPKSAPRSFFHNPFTSLTVRACWLLAGALIYQGVLMSVSQGTPFPVTWVWGLYYYGVSCVIFLVIALALACQSAGVSCRPAVIFTLAVVCGTTFIFRATNQVYKNAHYYPYRPTVLLAVFANETNRFETRWSNSTLLKDKANELRHCRATHAPVYNVPLELSYVLYETGMLHARNPGDFSKFQLFDLTWDGNGARVSCHN